jgi:hypothetical protein
MNTINYYGTNAEAFYERIRNTNLIDNHTKFLQLLPARANILDAGRGSGRDSKHFFRSMTYGYSF